MVSTVMRVDERKDTNEDHVVVGEGSGSGIGRQRAIHSTGVLEWDHSRVSGQQNASLQLGTSSANLFGERVVEDRTTTQRATAGQGRRRAAKSPRSVKRGRNFQGSTRRVV